MSNLRSQVQLKTDHEKLTADHGPRTVPDGHCACNLFSAPEDDKPNNLAEKLRAKYAKPKYKKLGWSEQKIVRVVAEQLAEPTNYFSGLREDLRWQLCDLTRDTKEIHLLVHFDSGNIESEPVSIRTTSTITCKELMENNDVVLEDALIKVVP